jgi:hypothetical protein
VARSAVIADWVERARRNAIRRQDVAERLEGEEFLFKHQNRRICQSMAADEGSCVPLSRLYRQIENSYSMSCD